jgi:hypothetical protein
MPLGEMATMPVSGERTQIPSGSRGKPRGDELPSVTDHGGPFLRQKHCRTILSCTPTFLSLRAEPSPDPEKHRPGRTEENRSGAVLPARRGNSTGLPFPVPSGNGNVLAKRAENVALGIHREDIAGFQPR